MKAFITGLILCILSLGVFAIDEVVTLEFLLKNSIKYFNTQEKEVASKLRGLEVLAKLKGLTVSQELSIEKMISIQTCRKNGYGMLHKISKSYVKKGALNSAFLTRSELELKGDELISLYDFFINPYLEYLNYRTEFLTNQLTDSRFFINEEMPYYVEEINIDGHCLRAAELKHYGEKGNSKRFNLELPSGIAINDLKRSKSKYIIAEINALKLFEKSKSRSK